MGLLDYLRGRPARRTGANFVAPAVERLESRNLLDATATLAGGPGANSFAGDGGQNELVGGPGTNFFFGTAGQDTVLSSDPVHDHNFVGGTPPAGGLNQLLGLAPSAQAILTPDEVNTLLNRAA